MTKILCNGCGKLIKERSKAYHDCVSTLSETTLCSALRGDSIHRTAVIDFVLALGLNQTCSHTIIAAYVCMEHQAAYCDYSGILQPAQQRLSVHKRSQVFEARFNDDEAFRARYIASVLTAKHGAICTDLSTDDYRHKLALKCIPSAPLVSTADETRFLKDFVKAFQDLLDLSTQMQLD